MGPIEDFKTSTTANEGQRADEHNHKNENKQETCRIGPAIDKTEQIRPWREEPLVQSEILCIENWIVHSVTALGRKLCKKNYLFNNEETHWSWRCAWTCEESRKTRWAIRWVCASKCADRVEENSPALLFSRKSTFDEALALARTHSWSWGIGLKQEGSF